MRQTGYEDEAQLHLRTHAKRKRFIEGKPRDEPVVLGFSGVGGRRFGGHGADHKILSKLISFVERSRVNIFFFANTGLRHFWTAWMTQSIHARGANIMRSQWRGQHHTSRGELYLTCCDCFFVVFFLLVIRRHYVLHSRGTIIDTFQCRHDVSFTVGSATPALWVLLEVWFGVQIPPFTLPLTERVAVYLGPPICVCLRGKRILNRPWAIRRRWMGSWCGWPRCEWFFCSLCSSFNPLYIWGPRGSPRQHEEVLSSLF